MPNRHEATPPLAASAWSQGEDSVCQAVSSAVARLELDHAALVLVFPDAAVAPEEVLGQARAAAPQCRIAGMTSEGLITAEGVRSKGCAAIAFGSEAIVGIGAATDASHDLRAAGRAAAEAAIADVDLRPGHGVLLIFVDPDSGDEADAIDGAYAAAGAQVPLAGGGANGDAPVLFADELAASDAVVAVAIGSAAPIAVGMAHGCRPRSSPAIATRTEGRALLELNGRPAEAVYLEGLDWPGVALDDDDFESLAILHPLAQPELRGVPRLRHVRGRATGGGLACATPIPPNAAVWFTEQSQQTIVESAADAVHEALGPLPGGARAGLVFDCAARKRAVGSRLTEEAESLLSAFGDTAAVTGLYTRGEVGRTRGAKGDRNHAVVVVAFG